MDSALHQPAPSPIAAGREGRQTRKRKRPATALAPACRPPRGQFDSPPQALVRPRRGDQPVQSAFDVAGDIRVRAFIDGDRCRRVRHVQIANATGDAGRRNRLLHLRRHIDELRAAIGFHTQCLHGTPSPSGAGILACSIPERVERSYVFEERLQSALSVTHGMNYG